MNDVRGLTSGGLLQIPWVAIVVFGILSVAAVQNAAAQQPADHSVCPADKSGLCLREDYLIQLSDVLDIHLPFSPEYDETVTVQPDGFIRLREAPPIRAAGLKVQELESVILRSYTGILRDPSVSVVLKDFQKPSFFASGEVGHPGRYDIRGDLTLMQAISEAGGLISERSRKKQVIIFRRQGNNMYKTNVVNLDAMLKAKGVEEDISIRPGDVIYVPQNKMSKIARYIPSPSMGALVGPGMF